MEQDTVSSPIFPALFIFFAVSSVTFVFTTDLKLSIGVSFFSTLGLIMFLKHLDSRERTSTLRTRMDHRFGEGKNPNNDGYPTRASLRSGITARIHKTYGIITRPFYAIYRSIGTIQSYIKFILSIIAAVITALIFSMILNIVQ